MRALLTLWALAALAAPARADLRALPAARRAMVSRSLSWCDRHWDERAGLLLFSEEDGRPRHQVRESVWYAAGLLLRGGAGDRDRALGILDRVLAMQYRRPERREYGSFPDAPEDPPPPDSPQRLKDYDPNWRQFIGTTLAVISEDFGRVLPAALEKRIDAALTAAVEGSLRDEGWITPDYTNIALMQAFLLDWTGARYRRADWRSAGGDLAARIQAGYAGHEAFPEFNSPTYAGVDLFALALWRSRAPSPRLRRWGAAMEAGLWRETARYYHAGLENVSGPYDRAYGMDMTRYVSLVGLPLLGELGAKAAPFPASDAGMGHALDFAWGPLYGLVPTALPVDARRRFLRFDGPRQVKTTISDAPLKKATAWLGRDAMWGAMTTPARGGRPDQLHALTAHWRQPDGRVGWLKLRPAGPIEASASESGLAASLPGVDLRFEVCASSLTPGAFTPARWDLPGLAWAVETDGTGFFAEAGTEPGRVEVLYRGVHRLSLRPLPATHPTR